MYKITKSKIFIALLVSVSLFHASNTAHAATFTYSKSAGGYSQVTKKEFSTLAACQTDLAAQKKAFPSFSYTDCVDTTPVSQKLSPSSTTFSYGKNTGVLGNFSTQSFATMNECQNAYTADKNSSSSTSVAFSPCTTGNPSVPTIVGRGCVVSSVGFNPYGKQQDGWYQDNTRAVDINLNTSGCVGRTVYLSVWARSIYVTDNILTDSGLDQHPVPITSDAMKLTLKLGEEGCKQSTGYDCQLYMEIGTGGGNRDDLYSSKNKAAGDLYYDCDGLCLNNAQLILPSSNPTQVSPTTQSINASQGVYNLLAPIGSLTSIQTSGGGTCPGKPGVSSGIGCYLNWIFTLSIGLCIALAVIMVIIASIQYMGTESIFGKTEAKSKGLAAIGGLLIALSSYAILNTINPDLLGGNGVQIDQVSADIGGDTNAPIGGTNVLPGSIVCGGGRANIPTIAASFNGKMTYSQDLPKGSAGPNGTIKLDCSGFANYVLKCAGVPFINGGSGQIFSGAEKVNRATMTDTSINGKTLQIGDLIGWTPNDDPRGNGHVMIYVGNGLVNDSHGPANPVRPGQAYGSFATTKYKSRITYIKRVS